MPEKNKNRPARSDRTPALSTRQGAPVVPPQKSKLSVMPLAVLLPPLGELSALQEVAPQLERRLAALQGKAQLLAGDEGVENAQRNAEESMLNQALQWLSVGESEK